MNKLIFNKFKINNRIYKNIKGLLFEFFNRTAVQLFFLPMMLYIWGVEITGIYLFLTSISSFANLVNFDPNEYTRQHLIINKGKKIETNKIYTNSFILSIINSLFFFLIVYITNLILLDKFTVIKELNFENLKVLIIIVSLGSALSLISNFFLIKFEIQGKIYIKTNLINFFFVLGRLLPILIGLFTNNFNIIFYVYIITKFIEFFVFLYFSKKINLFFNFKNIFKYFLKKIIINSFRYYILNIKRLLNVSGLNYIIGFFFNAEIVAIFSAINIMFKWVYVRLIGILHTIITYEIAKSYNKNSKNIMRFLQSNNVISYTLGLAMIIFTLAFGELFFNKWTLYKFENFFDIRTLIYLVLFEGILHQLSNNELVFLKAVNKIKNVATINVIIEFISLLIIFITLIKIQNIIIVVEIFIVKNLILLLINKIYKNKQLNK